VSPVEADEVLSVLDALGREGLKVWLDGGWGVDALLGEETRPHGDVDLVVELAALPRVLQTLETVGFRLAEDHAPVRVVLQTLDGRQADLHPVVFDDEGTGWQRGASPDGSDCPYPAAGFGHGRILGRSVPCLGPELQLEHHSGYRPRDRDRADMALLARRFSLSLPSSYGRPDSAG
jgi:lincosamide nucleotidyltransferase A/C/D/E